MCALGQYESKDRSWRDPYPESMKLFDEIYANPERFRLPLEGLLIVG